MDPEFDVALAIVLRKIADDPTRLNKLSHDILRKIILMVGNLQNVRTITVHGVEYSVNRLEEALRIDTRSSSDTVSKNDLQMSKCSSCERVHVWSGYEAWRLDQCMCEGCPNLICPKYANADCPGWEDTCMCKTCIPCDLNTYPRKCDGCKSK